MGSEWTTTTIGEIAQVFDGPHATPKKTTTGPVFLGISNLVNGRIDLSATEYLSEEDYLKWTRRVTPSLGDIVFSYETRLGEAAIVPEGLRCCLGRRMGLLRPKEFIDSRFLLYSYLGPEFQETLRQRTIHGSTVDRIPLIELPSFPIRIPPLPEQRAIAAVLGALDDKIELNRRMNGTLEAMARALFKSWFVDFDPVRAKMDGRPTGLPEEIEALFPGEMEEGRPLGWGVGSFSDLIQPTIGGDWGNDNSFESAVDVICLRGVDLERLRNTGWSDAPSRWIKQSSLIKRQLTDCDILVAASGVGPLGRPLWTTPKMQNVYEKPVIYSNFCKRFRAGTPAQAIYVDRVLHNMRENDEIWKYASGTSIPNLNQEALLTMHSIVIPPNDIIEHFGEFIRPIYEKLFNPESLTLSALRDALLPKLMSGEVRVSHAENLFGVI